MAFPLDPIHLRAHLRALILSHHEDTSDSAARIIRPLEQGLFHDELNDLYFHDFRPVSPPIPYDITEETPTIGAPSRLTHRRVDSKAKRKIRKSRNTSVQLETRLEEPLENSQLTQKLDLLTLENPNASSSLVNTIPLNSVGTIPIGSENTIPLDSLNTMESIGKKNKDKRHSLSKLFSAGPSILGVSLKKLEIKTQTLPTDETHVFEPPVTLSKLNTNFSKSSAEGLDLQLILGSIETAQIITPRDPTPNQDLSDDDTIERISVSETTSIKSINSRGTSSHSYSSEVSLNSSISDSSSSFSQESSSNRGSNIMYNYSVPQSYLLARNSDALFSSSIKVNNERIEEISHDTDLRADGAEFKANKEKTLADSASKQEQFVFEKTSNYSSAPSKNLSLLSSMISSRQNLIFENPLSYFSFVDPLTPDSNVKQASIDVFVPPQLSPILKNVSVTTNVSVFDCIGFFISKILATDEFKDKKNDDLFIDPNTWRMELIDSDGELYDSTFGVLERTRLLASYNYPRYLALCRITNPAEISKNNKQTPLPLEFKQNLETHKQRAAAASSPTMVNSTDQNLGALPENSVEVEIQDIPERRKDVIKLFVPPSMQIGGLFDLICRQYQVDQAQYKLVGLDVTYIRRDLYMSELISDVKAQEGQELSLESTATIEELGMHTFKLVHASKQVVKLMLNVGTDEQGGFSLKAGITPDASSFIQSSITPPKRSSIQDTPRRKPPKEESLSAGFGNKEGNENFKTTELIFDGHTFDDQFRNKSPDIPTTINTVYFKWKVFRKKPPLLNRIEKSLIIDGDYIHIAPADDVSLKKTSNDVLYGGSHSESKHHHHYLHHYNYSKYYNDTMMKTSSFHVSQIIKLKHFKKSKYPLQFKIVVEKDTEQGGKEAVIQKKYDLEAENEEQLKDMMRKIEWVRKSYGRTRAP